VWVLRHAKAASEGRDDHSRALTARGRRQATAVGRHIASSPVADVTVPELVLTSSARRAVQTTELVMAELDPSVELMVEKALYGADADDVIEIIRNFGGDAASVMVVGHNPTLHDLALVLLQREDTDGRARLGRGFPTAALAVSAVRTRSWAGLSTGSATLLELYTPER
jgi:phosphohistidine phosphatase